MEVITMNLIDAGLRPTRNPWLEGCCPPEGVEQPAVRAKPVSRRPSLLRRLRDRCRTRSAEPGFSERLLDGATSRTADPRLRLEFRVLDVPPDYESVREQFRTRHL